MKIQREYMDDDLIGELKDIINIQFSEVETGVFAKIKLDPDWDKYKALEEQDMMLVVTARDDGELVGYLIYFITGSLHHKTLMYAQQDVLYLLESYRKTSIGKKLIIFAEAALIHLGVEVVANYVKVAHDFSGMLEDMGYSFEEKVMVKRI